LGHGSRLLLLLLLIKVMVTLHLGNGVHIPW
jgi:hypothetical protein